jgi:hypothetical protein
MIAFLKTHVFLLAGLAMGILNLAIVIPQVITFDVFFFLVSVQSYAHLESSHSVIDSHTDQ